MNYQEYMRRVDAVILSVTGEFTHSDLRDFNTYDHWEAGVPAEETAREILEENGWGELL